jgi:hypothetical protein
VLGGCMAKLGLRAVFPTSTGFDILEACHAV